MLQRAAYIRKKGTDDLFKAALVAQEPVTGQSPRCSEYSNNLGLIYWDIWGLYWDNGK